MSTSGSAGSTSGSNAGAGGFYPGLAGFMGLELSEDVLRANMPEYLPENQVALRQSVRKFLNLIYKCHSDTFRKSSRNANCH